MMDTASEMSDAVTAFIVSPPSSKKSVSSGNTASNDDHPSEPDTGSSTCLYMGSLLPLTCPGHSRARSGGNALIANLDLHHLLGRHAVSGDRPSGGTAARAAGPRGGFPRGADLLRADALQQRLFGGGAGAGAPPRAGVRGRGGGGVAVRVVRRDGARALLAGARVTRFRASGVPGEAPGTRGRRRLLPAPRDLPPHLPLATCSARGGRAAAPLARGARHRPRRARRGGGVLRLRRHVRGQEPR